MTEGPGRYFEDFRLGEEILHATPRTLTEADQALTIALTGSRFALNCADPFAQALGLQRAPLDDWLVFNIVFGKRFHVCHEFFQFRIRYSSLFDAAAEETLKVFIDRLSLRLRPLRQEFRSLVIYLNYSAHLRRSIRELSLIIVTWKQLGNDQSG